jgi:hypothetical protein
MMSGVVPVSAATNNATTVPGSVLGADLKQWQIQLPFGNGKPGGIETISQSKIGGWSRDRIFYVPTDRSPPRAVLVTPVAGVHQSGTNYPRTELMGSTWNACSGEVHTLTVEMAVTHVPHDHPNVVIQQVHGKGGHFYTIMVWASDTGKKGDGRLSIYSHFDNKKRNLRQMLDDDYQMGDRFQVTVQVTSSKNTCKDVQCRILYVNRVTGKRTLNVNTKWSEIQSSGGFRTVYYKTGSYCQSNATIESDRSEYCETEMFAVKQTHDNSTPLVQAESNVVDPTVIPTPDPTSCTDEAPSTKYTCAQQVAWGKCSYAFMAGHCNRSCGRC